MVEERCSKCGKLLYKTFTVENGTLAFAEKVCLKSCEYTTEGKITKIQIKCPRCGTMNTKESVNNDKENRA